MPLVILLIFIPVLSFGQLLPPLGDGSEYHFMAGATIATGVSLFHKDPKIGLLSSFSNSVALGVLKEIYDKSRGGKFDSKDIFFTGLGGLSSALIMYEVRRNKQLNKKSLQLLSYSHIPPFLSGVSEGLAETLKWHYPRFQNRFPDANQKYWDPAISWRNKYMEGDPSKGPKFPGSTTTFAWTTDGYHLSRTIRNFGFVTTIVLYKHQKKKWYFYAIDAATHLIAYQVGFHTSYTLLFPNRR